VGGLCALLSNVAVIVLVRNGFTSLVASLLAFPPVLLIGYALHSAFTFGAPATRVTFGRYALAIATNFPAWAVLLYTFCDVLQVPVGIVAPAATALIFLWSYVATRWALLPAARSADPDALRRD
jgi:hypothetical protein